MTATDTTSLRDKVSEWLSKSFGSDNHNTSDSSNSENNTTTSFYSRILGSNSSPDGKKPSTYESLFISKSSSSSSQPKAERQLGAPSAWGSPGLGSSSWSPGYQGASWSSGSSRGGSLFTPPTDTSWLMSAAAFAAAGAALDAQGRQQMESAAIRSRGEPPAIFGFLGWFIIGLSFTVLSIVIIGVAIYLSMQLRLLYRHHGAKRAAKIKAIEDDKEIYEDLTGPNNDDDEDSEMTALQ